MHERAWDSKLPKRVLGFMNQNAPVKQKPKVVKIQGLPSISQKREEQGFKQNLNPNKLHLQKVVVPVKETQQMSRRFTVAEKLVIIDKYEECENISATCRWVVKHFNRATFARKSLSQMLLKEEEYRKACGTKSLRKTVRGRSGLFHLMDKELAC